MPRDADVTITPYRDGPLLVRGRFELRDQDGTPIDPGRDTIALCRCGRSRQRPFCDGTHRLTNFRASSGPQGAARDVPAAEDVVGEAPVEGG